MEPSTFFFRFGGGGGGETTFSYNLLEYRESTTWTKPANLVGIEIFIVGAGGGGASGEVTAVGQVSRGGAGGGAGVIKWGALDASQLSATEPVVVAAGGAGGAANSTPDSTINVGSGAGITSFGLDPNTSYPLFSNIGGSGGTTNGGSGGTVTTGFPVFYPHQIPARIGESANFFGGGGGATNSQSQFNPYFYPEAPSGGGIRNTEETSNGGVGGRLLDSSLNLASGAEAGLAGGGDGGDGPPNAGTWLMASPLMMANNLIGNGAIGGTGGGGGSSTDSNAGNAGSSGLYGVGGAGGGAARNGFTAGSGGAGSQGFIKILEILYT